MGDERKEAAAVSTSLLSWPPASTSSLAGALLEAIPRPALYAASRFSGLRTLACSKPPRLLLADGCLTLELEYRGYYSGDEIATELTWKLNPRWLRAVQDGVEPKGQPVLDLELRCDCSQEGYGSTVCNHVLAALNLVRQRLTGARGGARWLQSVFCDGQALGDELLANLERNLPANVETRSEEARIQWRLSKDEIGYEAAYRISCYLQKPKKRGGWTAGRLIRDIESTVPGAAFQDPNDAVIANLVHAATEGYVFQAGPFLQAVRLLENHPRFVWDRPGSPPVDVVCAQPRISFIERDGFYWPTALLDGRPLDSITVLKPIGKDAVAGFADFEDCNRFCHFTIPKQGVQLLDQVHQAQRRGACLSLDSAQRFADTLGSSQPTHSLAMVLPESLAGPEVRLPPTVELHLAPQQSAGFVAKLRIACEAVADAPVPGFEPACIAVSTPTGRCQFVRDLPAEVDRAQQLIEQLQLGEFAFDGPYTWIVEDLPNVLALLQRAAELRTEGLAVCWPESEPVRLVGEITPQALKVQLASRRDWFGLSGELSLEDLRVPLAELLASLRQGGRFVPLGDGQFATISDALRRRLAAIDDVSTPDGKRLKVGRASTLIVEENLGQDISAKADAKWRNLTRRLNDLSGIPESPPAALQAQLRDYQLEGYRWLSKLSYWGLGGCLADDMGLGKTVQALAVLIDRAEQGPTLVVAPTSVGTNWLRETERFAPTLRPYLYRDHDRDGLIAAAQTGDLVITSYALLQRDADRFASRRWGTLVLDESQYIKNFNTKTSQAVRRIDADWSLAISGTPLENHLGELWSLMRIICPGLLGSWQHFRTRFADSIERNHDADRLDALGRVVRPFILRRTKDQVLRELPPRTEVIRTVELSAAERKRYDAARLAALSDLTNNQAPQNEQQKRIRVLSWLTRLRQLACHVRLCDERWQKSSSKLDTLLEIIEELRTNQHRALVFSQFTQHLALVREALDKAGVNYQYLDGSTPATRRQKAIDAFQQGDGELFLISLKAGGTGLNLTAADYVLHLDPWWNPATEDQATDRAHRIGQDKKVTVYRLVTTNTIEEQILALHASKRELMSGVLKGTDHAGKISTSELVSLIRESSV